MINPILPHPNEVEVWKPVPNWEHRYEVSSFGRVRSLDKEYYIQGPRNPVPIKRFAISKVLNPSFDKDGYLKQILRDGKCSQNCMVHRLVAMAFHPNPDNLPQVNHIDCNKQNNYYLNLEWVTAQTNHFHGVLFGKINPNTLGRYKRNSESIEKFRQSVIGRPSLKRKLTNEQVMAIKTDLKNGMRNVDLAQKNGVSPTLIPSIKSGKSYREIEI